MQITNGIKALRAVGLFLVHDPVAVSYTHLQGPFVINVEERKACQIILEGNQYPVKFPIYDILKSRKAGE